MAKKNERRALCDFVYTHRMPHQVMEDLQVIANRKDEPRDHLVRKILTAWVRKAKKKMRDDV